MLTIRLSRIGKKKKPFYRVVVIERTRPRDGRVKEAVGTYDPLKKPAEIKLDADRIKYWMGLGAQPSDTVRSFLRQQKIAKAQSPPVCAPRIAWGSHSQVSMVRLSGYRERSQLPGE